MLKPVGFKKTDSIDKSREMDLDERFRKAQRAAEKTAREVKSEIVFQTGSSLRKEDFSPRSDVNLIVVSEGEPARMFRSRNLGGIDVKLVRESEREFIERLEKGNPMEILAWKYGEVLKGERLPEKELQADINSHTVEMLVHNALNRYQEVLETKGTDLKFRNEAYYSYRGLSRALIALKEEIMACRDREVKEELEKAEKREVAEKFWNTRNSRHLKNVEEPEISRKYLIRSIEDLADPLLDIMGLNFIGIEEAEEKLKKKGINRLKSIMYDLNSTKALIVGEKDAGGVVSQVYDLESGEKERF